MNQWGFVLAAYAVALSGAGALALASWRAMREAERPGSGGIEGPVSSGVEG